MSEAAFVPGRFVWADLMTSDVEAAKRFYFELFPTWKDAPVGAGLDAPWYHPFALEGRPVGGIVAPERSAGVNDGHGAPQWIPYATVASVDDACARAVELGGTVHLPPGDLPNGGRFALLADPQGALVHVIALPEDLPETSGALPQGTFCWHELVTTDPAAAKAFYATLFGWSHAEMPVGERPYHLFRRGDRDAAGMMQRPADVKSPPAWLVYMFTSDIAASVAKVVELGGAVHVAPYHVPGVGEFAVATDPMGAAFALFKSERA